MLAKNQWMAETPRTRTAQSVSGAENPTRSTASPVETNSPQIDGLRTASNRGSWPNVLRVSRALNCIYFQVFERVFSAWVFHSPGGSNDPSNPFIRHEPVSILKLCEELDCHLRKVPESHGQSPSQQLNNSGSDQSILVAAIQCFTVRWLPALDPNVLQDPLRHWHEYLVRQLWRRARNHMLKAINKKTYCCILSLLLFGLTPCPTGIEESEESDGLSGQICIQIALRHIYDLRSRHRTFQFSGFKVVAEDANGTSDNQEHDPNEFIVRAESLIYYAGMIFDTSASLTLNCRPLLTSGLLGFDQELILRLFQTRTLIYHDYRAEKQKQGLPITDKDAASIISHAGEWKLYTWKIISIVKEGLRDGHSDEVIARAFGDVLAAIDRFHVTHKPQMDACQQKLEFLSTIRKLDWCELFFPISLSEKC